MSNYAARDCLNRLAIAPGTPKVGKVRVVGTELIGLSEVNPTKENAESLITQCR